MGSPLTFSWTETIDDPAFTPNPRTVTRTATIDSDALAAYLALRDPIEVASLYRNWVANSLDLANLLNVDKAHSAFQATPRYIMPGDAPVSDAKGAVVAVHADGSVYRNGMRLGAAMTQRALLYGDGLFMKGKTDGKWWEWTGAAWIDRSTWTRDPAIFT